MSENTEDLVDMKFLEDGTTIKIEVPAVMHQRLQHLLYLGLPLDKAETYPEFLEKLKDVNTKDPIAFHARTLLWLIAEIENRAEEQGKMLTKKVNKTTGKLANED